MKNIIIKLMTICTLFFQLDYVHANFLITPQEAEILDLTNKERIDAGLKPLKINSHLMEVARLHSTNMAREHNLSHTVNGSFETRIEQSGYPYRDVGENIAQAQLSAFDVIHMWMTSEGHRKNILNSNFDEIGIGIAVSTNGDTYYTQVFGAQK